MEFKISPRNMLYNLQFILEILEGFLNQEIINYINIFNIPKKEKNKME